jgi:hypothetical protein
MFGSMQIAIRDGDEAPAQPAGVRIGVRRERPISIRLFRPQGTRIAVLASAVPAQLLALRAASVGATVRVQSPRPQAWGAVVRHGVDVSVAPQGAGFPPPGTPHAPVLVVDDRPTESGGLGDAGPWQCRLDLRAVTSPTDLGALAHADVLVFGQVSSAVATTLATMMGLNMALIAQLSSLGPGSVALVSRGAIQYVALDPSPAEQQLLAQSAR